MSKPIALVFGGSRGIGAACVQALAEGGFAVAYTFVASKPDATGAAGVKAYHADVSDPGAVDRVFADLARDFGSAPRCVVANAGINVPPAPVAQFDPAQFRKLVEVNLV